MEAVELGRTSKPVPGERDGRSRVARSVLRGLARVLAPRRANAFAAPGSGRPAISCPKALSGQRGIRVSPDERRQKAHDPGVGAGAGPGSSRGCSPPQGEGLNRAPIGWPRIDLLPDVLIPLSGRSPRRPWRRPDPLTAPPVGADGSRRGARESPWQRPSRWIPGRTRLPDDPPRTGGKTCPGA